VSTEIFDFFVQARNRLDVMNDDGDDDDGGTSCSVVGGEWGIPVSALVLCLDGPL
jgi:hypothetical protein